MASYLVFLIPVVSLLYLTQIFISRKIRSLLRITLIVFAIVLFLFDLFISLYFYSTCYEMRIQYLTDSCLNWIYPTLDFKLMVLVSVIMITLSVWGLVSGWHGKKFLLMGTAALFIGVGVRMYIFLQSIQVANAIGSISPAALFEFFTIMVVYGLVSALFYLGIVFLGLISKCVNA